MDSTFLNRRDHQESFDPPAVLYASSGQEEPAQGRIGITHVAIFGEQGQAGH